MSQLPDEIFVPKEFKYGTLDYVTTYLFDWAAEENGYKIDDLQIYIPSYMMESLLLLIKDLRKTQIKVEDWHKNPYAVAENREAYEKDYMNMKECERKIDQYLQEMGD